MESNSIYLVSGYFTILSFLTIDWNVKKKIHIIENDDEIKNVVAFILEAAGYEVGSCKYDPSALPDIACDLILLDEWINQREGHLLCRDIKAIQNLAHIPVIIFSTATDIEEIVKTCGADGFVRKPFDLDGLLHEVERCLPLKGMTQLT